ncbi:integrin beta-8-like [Phthorimaea operculella]|nr:integrin beta-8-like [Phthorimaea operculella]
MKNFLIVTFAFSFVGLISTGIITVVDEKSVCHVKNSCLECLRLPQCSWCGETEKCFSKDLPGGEDECKNLATPATPYVDYGLSLEGNARCACLGDELEKNCYHPATTDGPECFGRGKCECGRCVCDPVPDVNHTSKVIMGEYCEFDNFSCDRPDCNEGPYLYAGAASPSVAAVENENAVN